MPQPADLNVVRHGQSPMPPPADLIVVRHGQSTWNAEHRWAGQADPALSDLGRGQAAELAQRCRGEGIGAVVTSDLSRARETGEIVAKVLGLDPPTELPDLRERWSVTLSGLTSPEIEAAFPGVLAAWRAGTSTELPGDSEAFDAFSARILRGLRTAACKPGEAGMAGKPGEADMAGKPGVVLVVAHAGVLRTLAGQGSVSANADGRRFSISADGVVDHGPLGSG
ncbi:MAG TPA: histidine phosphatase family protein [Candidatus Limnocylindrales bacterium]